MALRFCLSVGMHGRGKRWCALHRNHEPGSVDVKNRLRLSSAAPSLDLANPKSPMTTELWGVFVDSSW